MPGGEGREVEREGSRACMEEQFVGKGQEFVSLHYGLAGKGQ